MVTERSVGSLVVTWVVRGQVGSSSNRRLSNREEKKKKPVSQPASQLAYHYTFICLPPPPAYPFVFPIPRRRCWLLFILELAAFSKERKYIMILRRLANIPIKTAGPTHFFPTPRFSIFLYLHIWVSG